jgi:hypothetical protein
MMNAECGMMNEKAVVFHSSFRIHHFQKSVDSNPAIRLVWISEGVVSQTRWTPSAFARALEPRWKESRRNQ